MKNSVQLITYVDRFGQGGLRDLQTLLRGPLKQTFGGVHLLPFFHAIDGADAGFDPIDHTLVDPRLGNWDDLSALSEDVEVMADLIVNHVSADSPQFTDYSRHGAKSRFNGLFLTLESIFPEGATEADLLKIYRPRPGLPFTTATLLNGEKRLLWTTFTPKQVDINVQHPAGKAYLDSILKCFKGAGVTMIRLDAAGYAVKKPGTSCFMIPETYAFIAELTKSARAAGIEVLVEIHSHYLQQIEIAKRVDRVYDFALPPLILHTLFQRSTRHLKDWLAISPRNALTVLDTHDGIGVIDVGADTSGRPGLLPPEAINNLVEGIHKRSENRSRKATGAAASNLDLYQVNCTFYEALGCDDHDYLIARALQFFAPGIPQVYYVGLLAGKNDMDLLERSGVGRDINRHHYSRQEILSELQRPVVAALLDLIRFRNTHPAFAGDFTLHYTPDHQISLCWSTKSELAQLDVDLEKRSANITCSSPSGVHTFAVDSIPEVRQHAVQV